MRRLMAMSCFVVVLLFETPSSSMCQVMDVSVGNAVGGGIQNATVIIQLPDNTLSQFSLTDEAGTYSSQMPSGTYDIHVQAPGYRSSSTRVTLPQSGRSPVTFRLQSNQIQPVPPPAPPPPPPTEEPLYVVGPVSCTDQSPQCEFVGSEKLLKQMQAAADEMNKTYGRLDRDVAAWLEGGRTAVIEAELPEVAKEVLAAVEKRLFNSFVEKTQSFIEATLKGSPPDKDKWLAPFYPFGEDSPELALARTRAAERDERWVKQVWSLATAQSKKNQFLQPTQIQRPGHAPVPALKLSCYGNACGQLIHVSEHGFRKM